MTITLKELDALECRLKQGIVPARISSADMLGLKDVFALAREALQAREQSASLTKPEGKLREVQEDDAEWDFWDAAGLRCSGYDSKVDDDVIRVFIETSSSDHWHADIAKRLGLNESYVLLLIEALCSAGLCEYGTSPRGAWAVSSSYWPNLAKLLTWFSDKWGLPSSAAQQEGEEK